MTALRTELRPVSPVGFLDWLRRAIARPEPAARVIAPATIHLGGSLEVDWWFFCQNGPELSLVTVSLVGAEVAHRRISARTGISVVTETSPFLTLELDRQRPERGSPVASGHAEALVPLRSVPSLTGKRNEIAWAVVIEAWSGAAMIRRQEFPIRVLAVSR